MEWLENIKRIKKEKGLTNESLSELSGISLGTLNKLLSGATSDPKLSTLTALSVALSCGIDHMLGISSGKAFMRFPSEDALIKKLRELDDGGRETVSYIINKEYARVAREKKETPYGLDVQKTIRLKLYNLSVSAGTGNYLTDSDYTEIPVYATPVTESADYAVRVSGDSMEPKYNDGDILLVSDDRKIEEGELGVFSLNGDAYFKKFTPDALVSLNPAYRRIPIGEYDELVCFGRVIGKLKK